MAEPRQRNSILLYHAIKSSRGADGLPGHQQEALMTYVYLIAAIVFEVVGTSALQASDQFTKPKPLLLTAVSYIASFYCLSLVLRAMPVGIAYGIWSGLGVVLITLVGLVWFDQKLDLPALIGLAMITGGVVIINLFSKTVTHSPLGL